MTGGIHIGSVALVVCFLSSCGASETTVPSTALQAEREARIELYAQSWSKEAAFTPAYSPGWTGGVTNDDATRAVFNEAGDYWGLPRTTGYELVDAYCTACHSLQIVMQQNATPARWDYMLDWMVEKQNMAPMPTDERAEVLAYLAKHFGSRAP